MPHVGSDSSDFEKLQIAFSEITSKFGSVNNILEAFGLSEMPMAQRYGILFGVLVFTFTVASVVALLVLGGSFERIAEQAETGEATLQEGYKSRLGRALLLERLLDHRERLLTSNYPDSPKPKEGKTRLSKMLMNKAPPRDDVSAIVDDDATKIQLKVKGQRAEVMVGYKENFVVAYRKCQDQPGGAVIPGSPEARFEAYARAYAGCGDSASLSYRRSYARIYESLACDSHKSDDKYSELYNTRPEDLIGKHVRLEVLDAKRHLAKIFDATSGNVYHDHKSYDSYEVWGFLEEGPFRTPQEMHKSFVFRHHENQAAFSLVHNVTDRILGVVMLSNDSPNNLSIQIDPPITNPSSFGTQQQLEACYLLIDRLFAYGYRRVQISIDAKDTTNAKLADRLGFTYEGCLFKHMVVKDSSRDSNIYGMLNSDWEKGARLALYKKLYGVKLARVDFSNNKKEEELDEQQRVLAERKITEEVEKAENNKKKT